METHQKRKKERCDHSEKQNYVLSFLCRFFVVALSNANNVERTTQTTIEPD